MKHKALRAALLAAMMAAAFCAGCGQKQAAQHGTGKSTGGQQAPAPPVQMPTPPQGQEQVQPTYKPASFGAQFKFVGTTSAEISVNGVPTLPPGAAQGDMMDLEDFLKPGKNTLRVQAVVPAGAKDAWVLVKLVPDTASGEWDENSPVVEVNEKPEGRELKLDKTFDFETGAARRQPWHNAEKLETLTEADLKGLGDYLDQMRAALANKDALGFLNLRMCPESWQVMAAARGMSREACLKGAAQHIQTNLMQAEGYKAERCEKFDATACGQLTVVRSPDFLLRASAPAKAGKAPKPLSISVLYFYKSGGKWRVFQ